MPAACSAVTTSNTDAAPHVRRSSCTYRSMRILLPGTCRVPLIRSLWPWTNVLEDEGGCRPQALAKMPSAVSLK